MPLESALRVDESVDSIHENPHPSNRRRCFRLATVLPLEIRVQDEHGEMTESREAISTDLSVTGLSFLSDYPIPPCSLLDVKISDLPFMDELIVPADVVRCEKITSENGNESYLVGADFRAYINRQLRTELQRSVTVLQRMKEHKAIPFF